MHNNWRVNACIDYGYSGHRFPLNPVERALVEIKGLIANQPEKPSLSYALDRNEQLRLPNHP
jgi:hypothetical protein